MKNVFGIVGFASLSIVGSAAATPANVQVEIGPAVLARMNELGRTEIEAQRQSLAGDVARALTRSQASYSQVRLVIEDIQPNRPTSTELGLSPSLSRAGSFGIGGAAIDGEVVGSDGARLPVRYRFFQPNLQTETNFTPWGDAEEAFDDVAHAIAAGHPPDQQGRWPPPHAAATPTGTRIPPG